MVEHVPLPADREQQLAASQPAAADADADTVSACNMQNHTNDRTIMPLIKLGWHTSVCLKCGIERDKLYQQAYSTRKNDYLYC